MHPTKDEFIYCNVCIHSFIIIIIKLLHTMNLKIKDFVRKTKKKVTFLQVLFG